MNSRAAKETIQKNINEVSADAQNEIFSSRDLLARQLSVQGNAAIVIGEAIDRLTEAVRSQEVTTIAGDVSRLTAHLNETIGRVANDEKRFREMGWIDRIKYRRAIKRTKKDEWGF